MRAALNELLVLIVAVLLSLGVGAILIALRGHDPFMVYGVWFGEALGSAGGRSQVIFKTTTLIFTALASALAFRGGMFNIGAEGQIYLGAFCAAALVFVLPASTPGFVAVTAAFFAALSGGAVAALIPAVLKVRRHTHEVITTMMMNFILLSVVNYFLRFARESAEVVRTPPIPAAWRVLRFERGYDGNTVVLLAIVLALFITWFLRRTRAGYAIRAIGSSPGAAELGGIATGRVTLGVLVASGAVAGLGGLNFVLGSPGYFEQHFAPFQGYLGIAVALLARNHPFGIVPAAFLFAVLAEGGQAIQEWAPPELGTILQAITVVFVVLGAELFARWEKRRLAHA